MYNSGFFVRYMSIHSYTFPVSQVLGQRNLMSIFFLPCFFWKNVAPRAAIVEIKQFTYVIWTSSKCLLNKLTRISTLSCSLCSWKNILTFGLDGNSMATKPWCQCHSWEPDQHGGWNWMKLVGFVCIERKNKGCHSQVRTRASYWLC